MKIDQKLNLGTIIYFSALATILFLSFRMINRFHDLGALQTKNLIDNRFLLNREKDHLIWAVNFLEQMSAGESVSVLLDHTQCTLGKQIYPLLTEMEKNPQAFDPLLIQLYKNELEPLHKDFHASGKKLLAEFAHNGVVAAGQLPAALKAWQEGPQKVHAQLATVIGKINDQYTKIEHQYSEEFDQLTQFMDRMLYGILIGVIFLGALFTGLTNIALRRFARQLMGTSKNLLQVTQEITKGNHDLSSRTQEQASSLEQSAATLEEVTSTVKQTADASQQAFDLSSQVLANANQGRALSGNTQSAMEEIATSSTKIAEIVGLVNNIAFQTNILAINAAIEAAKAGEQGKGFAVVAIEVRDLAQRSAEAAKEIKQLIDSSLEKVENGNKMVANGATMLEEIATGVAQVSQILADISSATKEQHHAIEQINQAVSQLDAVTQQNSVLVTELGGTSTTLSTQALALDQMVRTNLSVSTKKDENASRSLVPVAPQERSQPASNVVPFSPTANPISKLTSNQNSDDVVEALLSHQTKAHNQGEDF